jgi:microcystin-dependent protein
MRAQTVDNADITNVTNTAAYAPSAGGTLYQPASNGNMAFEALPVAGNSQPHNNMQPYLTLSYCIALQGVFPPRS